MHIPIKLTAKLSDMNVLMTQMDIFLFSVCFPAKNKWKENKTNNWSPSSKLLYNEEV